MKRSCLLAAFPALLLFACQSTPVHEINEKYKDVLFQRENHYEVKAGDTITVKFYNQDVELNQTLLVLPDGHTDPFFMDDAVFAGKTVKEIEDDITRYYAGQIKNPEISLGVTPAGETVILEGEVLRPVQQPLTVRMTLMQALGGAGGYKITACLHTVIVRRSYLDPKHPDVFRINLRDYADVPEDLFLLPSDHIIVEKNWAILVRDYINEYIWGFLPPLFTGMTGAAVATAI